jgi:branched-chain amino acid transport system substrate-binding protein
MADWTCDHSGTTYSDQEPFEDIDDQEECPVCHRKCPKGGGRPSSKKAKSALPLPLIAGIGVLLLLVGGSYFLLTNRNGGGEGPLPEPSPSLTPFLNNSPNTSNLPTTSSGETRLIVGQSNPDTENGINAFKSGNWTEATQAFTKAIQGVRTNPEPQIYLNNARARQAGSPFLIAVVVPIDNAQSSAEEMLRGVADAQTKFNDGGGLNGRLVEVMIANDGNDPTRAASIAQQLANDPNVLGVIGHNASDASKAALAEYEKAGLAMISPTSTSIELKGDVFTRTVPSDVVYGQKLAEYAKNGLKLQKVAVFYNPKSSYSKSLEQAFTTQFQQKEGQIVKTIDLSSGSFEPLTELVGLQGQAQGLVLLPDTKYTTVANGIAFANSKLPLAQRFKLLGGDAFYNPTTLTAGGNAVQGLSLVVPWVARTPYAKTAENRWGGQVSWRTAMSFDAGSALIKALSASPSRSSVLQALKATNLPSSETSGDAVKFNANGDRVIQPLIVRVAPGSRGPQGSKFEFQAVK